MNGNTLEYEQPMRMMAGDWIACVGLLVLLIVAIQVALFKPKSYRSR